MKSRQSKKRIFVVLAACVALFLGVILYLGVKQHWHAVFVGVFTTASLLPWTLGAKRITGKPLHHPVNILVMGFVAAVALLISSFLSEQIGIRSLERGRWELNDIESESAMTAGSLREQPTKMVSTNGATGTPCCLGVSEQAKAEARRDLSEAFDDRVLASAELREGLPPEGIVERTAAAILHSQGLSQQQSHEVDWDDIRLGILENLHGVEQAGVAAMMLEADQFMAAMGPSDAAEIAARTQRIWDQTIQSHSDFPATGPAAAMFRKLFEMQAALERRDLIRRRRVYESNKNSLMQSVSKEGLQERLMEWEDFRRTFNE